MGHSASLKKNVFVLSEQQELLSTQKIRFEDKYLYYSANIQMFLVQNSVLKQSTFGTKTIIRSEEKSFHLCYRNIFISYNKLLLKKTFLAATKISYATVSALVQFSF